MQMWQLEEEQDSVTHSEYLVSYLCSERHKVYRYNDKNVLISLFSLINRAMPHVCMLEALAWLYLLVHQYSN